MKKYNYAFGTVCILFFLSGNFLICTINGGEERDEERRNVKKMGEKERKKKEKMRCVPERGKCSYVKSYQVSPTLF